MSCVYARNMSVRLLDTRLQKTGKYTFEQISSPPLNSIRSASSICQFQLANISFVPLTVSWKSGTICDLGCIDMDESGSVCDVSPGTISPTVVSYSQLLNGELQERKINHQSTSHLSSRTCKLAGMTLDVGSKDEDVVEPVHKFSDALDESVQCAIDCPLSVKM